MSAGRKWECQSSLTCSRITAQPHHYQRTANSNLMWLPTASQFRIMMVLFGGILCWYCIIKQCNSFPMSDWRPISSLHCYYSPTNKWGSSTSERSADCQIVIERLRRTKGCSTMSLSQRKWYRFSNYVIKRTPFVSLANGSKFISWIFYYYYDNLNIITHLFVILPLILFS